MLSRTFFHDSDKTCLGTFLKNNSTCSTFHDCLNLKVLLKLIGCSKQILLELLQELSQGFVKGLMSLHVYYSFSEVVSGFCLKNKGGCTQCSFQLKHFVGQNNAECFHQLLRLTFSSGVSKSQEN